MTRSAEVVICGAGIAGISAAYFLARCGVQDILIVDEREPLSLTSSRSTECYRNWWPDRGMVALMNRSIDWLEELAGESNNVFGLNQRGYLYVTSEAEKLSAWQERGERIGRLGAGELRVHTEENSSYPENPTSGDFGVQSLRGADLLVGTSLIRRFFPCLTEKAALALHVRRAGWLDSIGLGNYLLNGAKQRGVRVESQRVSAVDVAGGAVRGVRLGNGESIATSILINAAGPFFKPLGQLAGLDLPVYTELHQKVAFRDTLGVIPRDLPLTIWDEAQSLLWSTEECEFLAADPETAWLTETFPAGAHLRPDGGEHSPMALFLWEYVARQLEPVFPPPLDEDYPEVTLRGLARMLPGLEQYLGRAPKPIHDGGYYTRTRENRPLVGPTPVKGFYLCGAVSGYGIMSACGVGDLLAAHVTGQALPEYAPDFALARYENADYVKGLENWEDGQL